jgi:hypothetical protein
LNKPKVERVSRELVYLRGLDTLLVFDRVRSFMPEFKKTWLLHSLGDLEVLDGREERMDAGESRHPNATRAVISHGWTLPVPSFGRCLSVTLLPENAEVRKIGGRVELEGGERASWPGDQWHGKHAHRHTKDFWVKGTNYPPGNPPEIRWFGDPTSQGYVRGTPDESGGRGKWRLEVSPARPALEDVFFHALAPRLGKEGRFPEIEAVRNVQGWHGVRVTEQGKTIAVFFSAGPELRDSFKAQLSMERQQVLLVGLSKGSYKPGQGTKGTTVGDDGVLFIEGVSGAMEISRQQER